MTLNELLLQLPPPDAERASFLLEDLSLIASDAPKSFLDMGAGSGSMSAVVALQFPGIRGVLVDVIARLSFLDKLPKDSRAALEFLSDPQDHRLHERKFDLVCSMDVLEHIPNWKRALNNLVSHVGRAGLLYIQAPSNYPSPNYPSAQVFKNRIKGMINRHDPSTHVRHGLSVKQIVDVISDRFELLVASESYVTNGTTHCSFKPRTHVLARQRP